MVNEEKTKTWAMPKNMMVVDVETTGLDAQRHSIHEIGMGVMGDAGSYCFRPRPGAEIEQAALDINGQTRQSLDARLAGYYEGLRTFFGREADLRQELGVRKWVICGINPSFDLAMLRQAWRDLEKPDWHFPFAHRVFDLHTVGVSLSLIEGRALPPDGLRTDELYALAKLKPEPRPHSAINGVACEMRLLAKLMEC